MKQIDDSMDFNPSEACTLSCGTVCVDPRTARLLLIFNERLNIYQLPKGRKHIDEDMATAALRETKEETGVSARLLPLKLHTRATVPPGYCCRDKEGGGPGSATATDAHGGGGGGDHDPWLKMLGSGFSYLDWDSAADPSITTNVENTEFISVVVYDDMQARMPDAARVVFYFAAQADSTAPLGPDAQELEKHERLRAEWVPMDAAVKMLRFSGEVMTVWKLAVEMRRSGLLAAAEVLALYRAADPCGDSADDDARPNGQVSQNGAGPNGQAGR